MNGVSGNKNDLEERKLESLGRLAKDSGGLSCYQTEDFGLYNLIKMIWDEKWLASIVTLVVSSLFLFYALSMPNIYKPSALLAPSKGFDSGGISPLSGQLGGLASLAGFNLEDGGVNPVDLASEIMSSRSFSEMMIVKYDLLVPLMAASGWDGESNRLILDADVYDEERKSWSRKVQKPREAKPSMWEAHQKWKKTVFSSIDRKKGFLSLSVKHVSPVFGKVLVERIILEINRVMKERDVNEAKRNIDYLNRQLKETSIANMQSVFYRLVEEQHKTLMLAQMREEYVFTTIDAAVVEERTVGPKRFVIFVVGVIFGLVISFAFILVKYNFNFSRKL